ncbi:hypothetical protein NW939_08705 [Aeromonas caviae]|uniref:hypothetical protein n=1 Tax=Aeromonas caviae TaxID=648 RepID=UPI0021C58427|nr:hypothetical protein [Aeromonas caviae]MCR9024697.1 hypothetical protein [Aeromonas caviae]
MPSPTLCVTPIFYTTLISVAFRFMSGWLFWLGLQVSLLTYLSHHQLNEAVVVSLFSVLVYWLSAVLCWVLSPRLARWIIGRENSSLLDLSINDDVSISDPSLSWIKVAVIFCGLLLLTQDGVRESGNFLTMLVMLIKSGQSARLLDASINMSGILALMKLSLGILLVVKAKSLATWIDRKSV